MPINRTEKGPENINIGRGEKSPSTFRRSEALSTRFGGGKFGVGRFSRKKILREKNIW